MAGDRPEVLVNPEEVRHDWPDYPDSVKRQACLYYMSGDYQDDEAIGRAVGAPALLIARWRAEGEPGGTDWHALRKARESGEWYVTPASARFNAAETADGIMHLQGMMLEIVTQALEFRGLVDEHGDPVDFLWDAETGKKVPINAMSRPKSLKEVSDLTKVMLDIEKLRDTAEERRLMVSRFIADMETVFSELVQAIGITDEQKDRFRATVERLQNQGRLPEGALLEVQFRGGGGK